MRRNSFHIIGFLLGFAAAAAPVHAVTARAPAGDEGALHSVAGATRIAGAERARALERMPGWRGFRARYGAWHAVWNEATGTPHRAWGRGIPLRGFAGEASAVDAAVRTFIAAHPEAIGRPAGLETASVSRAGGRWYARYRQTLKGVPLLFADLEFRIGADGRLFAFGADTREIPAETRTEPVIPAAVARVAATRGLPFVAGRDRVEAGTGLFLFPRESGGALEYRLVYDVRVRVADPPGHWITLVDAEDGEVLWRLNRVRHEVTGTVSGEIHPLLPTDPLEARPFAQLEVGDGTNTAVTNPDGAWSLPPNGAVTIAATLAGPWVDVDRLDGPDAAFSAPASSPEAVPIAWTDLNSHVAERDGFYHTNVAYAHAKAIDPGFTGNDYSMPCVVNIANTCNAYWDGVGINFYLAGGGCPNTATMADVVYHEYGHGVNDNLYIQAGAPFGMMSGALHEGLADVNAAMIRDNPVIGDGFFGPGTMIRTTDNTRRWPHDDAGDGHITGLIVGGAMWDLREAIGLTPAARLAHFAKYGTPDDANAGVAMSDYFLEVLVADDDDSDLANGTPNGAAIVGAFNAHGIGTGFFTGIVHTPLGDQPGASPAAVVAEVEHASPFGLAALDPSTVRLHYAVDGGPEQDVAMTPTGIPGEFAASIPGQSAALVRYWISAGDTEGGVSFDPPAAPGTTHLYIAGPSTTLLADAFEADPGYSIGAPGDAATTGLWAWGDPVGSYSVGTPVQPEDDHSDPGIRCYFTGNAAIGAGPGSNDVDGGRTTLTSASFDATSAGAVKPLIEYWRWYSNDQGGAPSTDLWRVHISNDGGVTWAEVESTTVSTAGWERAVFFIEDHVAPSADMKLRWIAADEGAGSLVEAGVDDLRVLDFSSVTAIDAEAGPRFALSAAAPNPFAALTRLRFTLPGPAATRVRVYDVNGRLVRTLRDGVLPAGPHGVEWDGRDAHAREMPNGVYFVRLSSGRDEVVRPLVRMR
jgi:hypothetical protein